MSKLEFYKEVLQKVSFNKQLLNKEFTKAKQRLTVPEVRHLEDWYHSIKE